MTTIETVTTGCETSALNLWRGRSSGPVLVRGDFASLSTHTHRHGPPLLHRQRPAVLCLARSSSKLTARMYRRALRSEPTETGSPYASHLATGMSLSRAQCGSVDTGSRFVRPAVAEDGHAIGQAHGAAWEAAFANILDPDFLRRAADGRRRGWVIAITDRIASGDHVWVAGFEEQVLAFSVSGDAQ